MELPVLVTYANIGYADFAKNLLLNLNKQANMYKVHFYCLDKELKDLLEKLPLTISVVFEILDVNVSTKFENYGSYEYNKILHVKNIVIRKTLALYNFIHFIDCDVVCMKAPDKDYWFKYIDKDIVFQYDCGFHNASIPHHPFYNTWVCLGNITLRNTICTNILLDKIDDYQHKYPNKNDQECLKQYFDDLSISDITKYIFAKLEVYPYEEFTNGYWVGHNIGGTERTFFFHANHVIGADPKRNLLKKVGHWYL